MSLDLKLVEALITDKRLFTESLMQIYDKQRNLVPFHYNRTQADYHAHQTYRDVITKAAQLGFTSKIMADFLIDCITRPGTTSIVVAHEEFITQRLLNKAQFFYDVIPDEFKPPLHHRSTYELTWPDLHSVFYIGSARSFVFGRGERIDNFLGSEIAFWPDPEKIMVPVEQRVPLEGRIILESTANGEGNLHHSVFKAARAGSSTYRGHFYPWWWGGDYRLPADSPHCLERDRRSPLMDLSDDELRLMEKHSIDEDQIRWRRMKLASPSGVDFFQEFPEDEETCFYTSTLLYFYESILKEWLEESTPPILRWEDFLDVWNVPSPNGRYIISADPTEGIQDKGAIIVWNIAAGEKVRMEASASGWWEPPLLADMLKKVGRYYKSLGRHPGMIVVERNGPGIATLADLVDYSNLYCMPNLVTGHPGNRPGWQTNKASKPYLLSNFKGLMEGIMIQDARLVRELRGFRRVGPDVECFGEDDLAMAAVIGIAAMNEYQHTQKGYVGSAPGWRW